MRWVRARCVTERTRTKAQREVEVLWWLTRCHARRSGPRREEFRVFGSSFAWVRTVLEPGDILLRRPKNERVRTSARRRSAQRHLVVVLLRRPKTKGGGELQVWIHLCSVPVSVGEAHHDVAVGKHEADQYIRQRLAFVHQQHRRLLSTMYYVCLRTSLRCILCMPPDIALHRPGSRRTPPGTGCCGYGCHVSWSALRGRHRHPSRWCCAPLVPGEGGIGGGDHEGPDEEFGPARLFVVLPTLRDDERLDARRRSAQPSRRRPAPPPGNERAGVQDVAQFSHLVDVLLRRTGA